MAAPGKKRGAGIAFVLPGSNGGGSDTAPTSQAPEGPERPAGVRTGVGLLTQTVFEAQRLEHRIGELNDRVEQLTAERGAQRLDPAAIVASRWANRHPDSFAGPAFEGLKREIGDAGGNVQPIKVRPLAQRRPEDVNARYEIVFGHRRHRACLELALPVLAVVEEVDDPALFVQMERENRGRESLSAWEQGRMYLRAIEEGLFTSNIKLAAAIGRDPSDVGKATRIARLRPEVTSAFPSPNAIQFRWVTELEKALKERESDVLAVARTLSQARPRPPASEVYAALTTARTRGVGPSHPPRQLDLGGGRFASVMIDGKGRSSLTFGPGILPPERWDDLETSLRRLLKP